MIYTIENQHIRADISTLGATLVSFIDKKTGTDIVLGYDRERDYLLYSGDHLGATVGRCANRIGGGRFEINGETYQLTINNAFNTLHSGQGDFSFRAFDVKEVKEDSVTLTIRDGDMSGGFPGELTLDVTYKLEGNELLYCFKGICDKDSIFNITNHAYFNLNGGKGTIYDQDLQLFADKVSINDENGMAKDECLDVDGTAFDFKEPRNIKSNLDKGHDNLSNGGIDHNYVVNGEGDRKVAILSDDKLELTVTSDLPCVHVYTANWLNVPSGKYGLPYGKHSAICLECDYYPNGINYSDVEKPIIKAGVETTHYIRYTLRNK